MKDKIDQLLQSGEQKNIRLAIELAKSQDYWNNKLQRYLPNTRILFEEN